MATIGVVVVGWHFNRSWYPGRAGTQHRVVGLHHRQHLLYISRHGVTWAGGLLRTVKKEAHTTGITKQLVKYHSNGCDLQRQCGTTTHLIFLLWREDRLTGVVMQVT